MKFCSFACGVEFTAAFALSVAPAICPRPLAAVSGCSENSALPRSSACVPNSDVAICACCAGSFTARRRVRISPRPCLAAGPPLAIFDVICSALRPRSLYAATVVFDPSTARIENSLTASATRSASRAPPCKPWLIRPVASAPDKPTLRNCVPYSFSVSSRSSLLFAPDWKPLVMMSNASSALFAMPVRIICDTARVTPPRSWSNVFDTVRALPDIAASVLSDAPRIPSMSWMTDFMASLMSAESPMLLENSLPAAVPARAA